MLESNFRFHRKNSYKRQKTKEELEKEISGLPKHIGPYELIEKLKDGGYSRVFKAKSCYTGDFVAIKLIDKMCFQESVEDVLLMIRQTEVLKISKHRNLISLYEIYESTKYFYLIMDYLPNGDLIEKIIKQKRFKEEEALNIFSQLVDALYYMHKNDICHRDIRTEKILFDKNNKPKLVGFSYSTFYTQGKKIKDNYGSLCYACPEIIQNDYYNPELADVWSLGVVLYVMICGYLPFSEDDDEKNKELIINGEVEYPPEISNKVKDLLKHMLDINPNKRYNFQRIIKHPWFKPYSETTLTGGCNIYKMIYPIDERILKIIVIYGFKKNEIDMDLKQNKFNLGTGLYKQLTNKFLNMGFTSFSDLCSEDFMEFKQDKENSITDGEKKYKKYITKILEKIKKVERYVNEYKRKEDKVIRDLDSIYTDAEAEAEEMKKEQKQKELLKLKRFKIPDNKNNNEDSFNKEKNALKGNQNENCDPKHFQRRTLSPMLTVKEQKDIKNYLASKIGYIKKDKNINNIKTINNKKDDEENDFDAFKDFEDNKKLNEINNILVFDEEDENYNDKKLKRYPSNPNIKEFVKKLMEKDNDYDLLSNRKLDKGVNDEIELRPIKRKRQLSVMIKKKKRNYLNTSSINDSFLRKPKDEKERKRRIKNNLISSINQVIIEENVNEEKAEKNNEENNNLNNNVENNGDNNNNINNLKRLSFNNVDNIIENIPIDENREENDKEIQKVETKKGNNLRYSLSFGDDDEELDEESGFISKIESKQVSMYDIDEELKELKEIKNTLKSPVCGPYLKPHTTDNKLFNFNIDNNSTIFGEHLDDNNITNNTNATALASINEKIDILNQLKKLSNGTSTEIAKSKYDEDNKIIENNQFKNESFGENQNYKREYSPIVFDDQLEISFHDENNKKINNDLTTNSSKKNINIYSSINSNFGFNYNINNTKDDMIDFYPDIKKLNQIHKINKTEELLFSISYVDSIRQNNFCFKYFNDVYSCKKILINNINDNLTIYKIEEIMNKNNKKDSKKNIKNNINKKVNIKLNKNIFKQKEKEEEEDDEEEDINTKKKRLKSGNKKKKIKLNKEKILGNQINSSIEIMNNLSSSINTNTINDIPNNFINSNMNTIDKSETINPLLSSQDNQDNFLNYFNNNENDKQKIYIIDNINNFENSGNENESQKDENNRNNIIINSNNNTINNISINNKNNYGNYYQNNSITNNNYYNNTIPNDNKKNEKNKNDINNGCSKNIPNKLDWSKLTNKFNVNMKNNNKNLNLFYQKDKSKVIISRNENQKKNELYLLNTDKKNKKYKSNKKVTNYSSIYTNISLNSTLTNRNPNNVSQKNNQTGNQKYLPLSLKKNYNIKEKSKKSPMNKKKSRNFNNLSVEKALHSNLMSNDFENPEDKKELISKVKKGQKIYQYVINENKLITTNTINYNKYVRGKGNKKNKTMKKEKTNYVQQYHKKINSNINNNTLNINNANKKDEFKEQNKHIKTKSDIINYDYLFSIYNEMNKNKNNDNIFNQNLNYKKHHAKHQSMEGFLGNNIKEEDKKSFKKNEFDDNNFF